MKKLVLAALPTLAATTMLLSSCSSSGSNDSTNDSAGSTKSSKPTATKSTAPVAKDCTAALAATAAPKGTPANAIAIGPDCSIYYYDGPAANSVTYGTIVRIAPDGTATTIAGGPSGDGADVPATKELLSIIRGIAVGPKNDVYVTDGTKLAKITTSGRYQVIMANTPGATCKYDPAMEGKPASTVKAACPLGVAADANGNVYVWSESLERALKIDPSGIVTTVAGGGTAASNPKKATDLDLSPLASIAVAADGNLLVLDGDIAKSALYRVAPDGSAKLLGGGGSATLDTGSPLAGASLFNFRVATGPAGNPVLAQAERVVTIGADGKATVVAFSISSIGGDGGPASKATVGQINAATVDGKGNVYLVDATDGHGEVRRIGTDGVITKVA